MSLTATQHSGGDFEMTPEGQYIARCYRIIDLGTQTTTGMYGTKEQHKVMISWELIGEDDIKMQDGRPFSVHKNYTVSLSEKGSLRPDLEAWRGKKFTSTELEGFDLSNVLGQYCMIQVVHSEDGKFANVQTIMSYKGDKPKPVNENVIFDIDNPDMKVFESLSDNMKLKIQSAPEWKGSPAMAAATDTKKQEEIITDISDEPINLDDIPF
jgi:hypothetical protein